MMPEVHHQTPDPGPLCNKKTKNTTAGRRKNGRSFVSVWSRVRYNVLKKLATVCAVQFEGGHAVSSTTHVKRATSLSLALS